VQLRELQRRINEAVCGRYGWTDIELACGFHEVGYLPAGNVRFTISESARLELLQRLSRLNKTLFEREAQHSMQTTGSVDSSAAETAERHDLFSKRAKA
jgi:hypothetical protein